MIRAPEIRVIDAEGQQLGVMTPEDAVQKAEEVGLDLVEVAPAARPPVCRIMDYGRYKYEQKKKTGKGKRKRARGKHKGGQAAPAHGPARSRLQAQERAPLPARRRQGEGHGDVSRTRDGAPGDRAQAARPRGRAARDDRGGGELAAHGRAAALDDPGAESRSDRADGSPGEGRRQGGRQ